MTLKDLYCPLRSGHVQVQGLVDTLEDPLLVLDGALNVSAVNPAFLRTFGIECDEVIGQKLWQLGQGVWNTPEVARAALRLLERHEAGAPVGTGKGDSDA